MKKFIGIAGLILLSACAGREPSAVPMRVELPVLASCAVSVERPVFATGGVAGDADLYVKARAVLSELEQRKAYEAELEAVMLACGGTGAPDTRPKS